MTKEINKPKPDDRSDNVDKLQNMVDQTIESIEKSHDTIKLASSEEKAAIQAKNKRREESIDNLRDEITDEYNNQLK